ncbi:hypothetical protein T484DRAFT_1816919 [Baffinella frigidus]|nr:hypothetical protein T484DRAFT_1816919 [Cryptophyta sp. CCMP2293]
MVQMLMAAGVAAVTNLHGVTVLMMILDAGADVAAADLDGSTALLAAVKGVQILIDAGAAVNDNGVTLGSSLVEP